MRGAKDLSFSLCNACNLWEDFIEVLLRFFSTCSGFGELNGCWGLVTLDCALHARPQVFDIQVFSLELISVLKVLPIVCGHVSERHVCLEAILVVAS